jgi:hypothetical protein
MNRLKISAGFLLAAMLALTSAPGYAGSLQTDATPHASKMAQGDQRTGKTVVASTLPAAGQNGVAVTEKIYYRNVAGFCLFRCGGVHDTAYFIQRQVSAVWVQGLNRFIVQDSDGDWYAFDTGSAVAVNLHGKPSYDVGARTSAIGAGDSRTLATIGDGGASNSGRSLRATYKYTHAEALDNVTYSMAESVQTTYVPEQQAAFAYVSQQLWSVDGNGHVAFHSEKPWADEGQRGSVLSSNDRPLSDYPSVTAGGMSYNSRTFNVIWTYVHEQDFQRIRYNIQSTVQADLVQLDSGSAYMAWIGSSEFAADNGSSSVVRLSDKPIVHLGGRNSRYSNDSATAVDAINVIDSNPVLVTLRYTFSHDSQYVVSQYYVDRQVAASYSQNRNLWFVNVDGLDYVVAFSGDDTSSWSGNVVHAPSSISRPQYVVPGTGGAVVPGRPSNSGTTGNSCIQGVDPGCGEAPAVTPQNNNCIVGVDQNCGRRSAPPVVTPRGNTCIKGVDC